MAKVYVSSTFLDLKDCRARVNLALRKVGHEDVAMEYYAAGTERPVERCLADVAECDLYVGLFAWRYGHVPAGDNPEALSITEMEYRRAQGLGKPCLIFLLSEDAPWPRRLMDKDATRIERLRSELSASHLTSSFTSVEDIADAVYPAVYRWSEKRGHLPRTVSLPELYSTAYVNALTRRYQHLDLDALTPPQRDENLRQRLREIFVEQNVRENPPPVELPKEVWEKLQRDREIHPEDLPTGVMPEDILGARESYFEKPSRPVIDALTDPAHRHSVVLGDPGSGKSTLARYLLLSLLGVEGDERLSRAFEGHLPLLIELRSYAGFCSKAKDGTFLDFVESMSRSEGWGLDRKALEHYLKTGGSAVVVFDGLDEIFDPEDRESAARRIAGFASTYPKARILVTSRVIGYKRKVLTAAEFSHFTLQDLDEQQVEHFIDRWYALALDERPDEARARRERIMRSFKDSPSIRQLAGNPMLLTIMAIIGKNQELPRERWKLYDHAASVLIHHWDVERHLRDRHLDAPFIGEGEKKELLRRLAYKMQSGAGGLAGNYIHRDDLQREFETYLRDRFAQPPAEATTIARAMIDQFRARNFILSFHGANFYGFVHRAFLEFFCASAFVQKFEKSQDITLTQLKEEIYGPHWRDQNWREVLRLICGMLDEKFSGEIILYLINRAHLKASELDEQYLALALQCFCEVRNSGALTEPATRLLLAICQLFEFGMSKMESDMSRVETLRFLEGQIMPAVGVVGANWPNRKLIAGWLRDFNPLNFSRNYAEPFGMFVGLVGHGLPDVHNIILSYVDEAYWRYRALVPFALAHGWPQHPGTLPTLRQLATTDPNWGVRSVALRAIGKHYKEEEGTSLLLQDRAMNDENWVVRRAVLRVLSKHFSGDAQIITLLYDRAANDRSEEVRESVVWVLGEYFRDAPNIYQLLYDRAVNDGSPSPYDIPKKLFVRETAIRALAKYWGSHPGTRDLLRDRAANDPTPWLRDKVKKLMNA